MALSARIIKEVSIREGLPAEHLEPLNDYIDVDALESIIKSNDFVWVAFQYMGYRVVVDHHETIYIT